MKVGDTVKHKFDPWPMNIDRFKAKEMGLPNEGNHHFHGVGKVTYDMGNGTLLVKHKARKWVGGVKKGYYVETDILVPYLPELLEVVE